MLSRYVTSIVSNLLRSPSSLRKIESRRFHGTSLMHQEKKKNVFPFSKQPEGPKIIKPGNCADSPKPILEPSCKIAVIIGGSDGFGFAAADHLLCKGARVSTLLLRSLRFFFVYRVNGYVYFNSNSIIFTPKAEQGQVMFVYGNIVIVDSDLEQGQMAAQKLCDSYGKDRVQFLECDIKNACQFEATWRQALCKHKGIHILFNDLDKESFSTNCNKSEKKENNTARVIQIGLNFMGKNHGGPGGIIVNCASIFGFMGWPLDPFPIYCKKVPAIEITKDFAKEHKIEKTGVRLVALCPTNKQFSDIGLPDFPDPIPNKSTNELPPCTPTTKHQVGSALTYVMAWAQSGSTWLVEPAISVHEIPRLIHFPSKEGEKVDPKVYETQPCTVKLEPPCAKATTCPCPLTKESSCDMDPPKEECGKS